jgi:capsid assembly protease
MRIGAASARDRPQAGAGVAVLPVLGTISHRMGMFSASSGGTSTEALTREFRSLLADSSVSAIVLDVDSPGGSADGIDELATEIFKARGKKPITAVANTLMASAAYWLAASADEIVVSPSAEVGSIGVLAAHEDRSALMEKLGVKVSLVSAGKYKTEGNPFEPLSDEARANIQKRVDEAYGRFVRAVARGRSVPVDTVRNGFGEGRVVSAREAVRLGMADRVATIDEVIATMPTTSASSAASTNARLGAVSYEEHGQLVATDLALFVERTRDRIAYRRADPAGVDRPLLSEVQRRRLATLRDELTTLLAELDPPGGTPALSQTELFRLRARIHDMNLVLADAG